MGTILNEMANWYGDFFRDGEFDKEGACRVLHGLSDIERRSEYINCLYDTILNSSKISETVKIYLKTRKSYADVAYRVNMVYEGGTKKKTATQVKAEICYANKRIMSIAGFQGANGESNNFFHAALFRGSISEQLWSEAEQALLKLRTLYGKGIMDKGELWVNIPVGEYATEIDEAEFDGFIKLISPYFQKQKMVSQKKINDMKRACGYLNFIMKNELKLSETDLVRKQRVLALLHGEQTDVVSDQKDRDYVELQERLKALEDETIRKERLATEALARAGMVVYSRLGISMEKEHKQEIRRHFEEYNSIKEELIELGKKREYMIKDMQRLEELKNKENNGLEGGIME